MDDSRTCPIFLVVKSTTSFLLKIHIFVSLRVCLRSTYFTEIEIFLLKVLYIKINVSWNSTVGPMNSSKNKLNSKINRQKIS